MILKNPDLRKGTHSPRISQQAQTRRRKGEPHPPRIVGKGEPVPPPAKRKKKGGEGVLTPCESSSHRPQTAGARGEKEEGRKEPTSKGQREGGGQAAYSFGGGFHPELTVTRWNLKRKEKVPYGLMNRERKRAPLENHTGKKKSTALCMYFQEIWSVDLIGQGQKEKCLSNRGRKTRCTKRVFFVQPSEGPV